MSSKDERLVALLLYVTNLFGFFIIPLIIWLVKKDDSKFIDFHGRNFLNLSITVFIYTLISAVLVVVLVGIPLLVLTGIYFVVYSVIAAIKTYEGEYYQIPFMIRFFKTNPY